jgi:hypothetical protein
LFAGLINSIAPTKPAPPSSLNTLTSTTSPVVVKGMVNVGAGKRHSKADSTAAASRSAPAARSSASFHSGDSSVATSISIPYSTCGSA